MGYSYDDLEPIPQDDGPEPIVPIAYSPQFVDVMDLFRAILKKNEISERSFALSEKVIESNSANYTAWHVRRLCLLEVPTLSVLDELDFTADVAQRTPKNYQLWHHRRFLIDTLGKLYDAGNTANGWDPTQELAFTESILIKDTKNYHVWAHRQWVLNRFNIFDNELEYVDTLLELDLRNNSAWNQRFFVIGKTSGFTADVVDQEISCTFKFIVKAPSNESPWNYVCGLLPSSNDVQLKQIEAKTAEILVQAPRCAEAMSLMVDLADHAGNEGAKRLDQAISFCGLLAEKVDPVRKQYWVYRLQKLTTKLEALNTKTPPV